MNVDQIILQPHDISFGIHTIAQQIRMRLDNPCFWVIMNGAWLFSADLLRQVPATTHVEFLHIRRGFGAGKPHKPVLEGEVPLFDPELDHIFVDIISETGTTLNFAKKLVRKGIPVYTCSLIYKTFEPDFTYLKKDDNFFYTGYGMGPMRQLPYIAVGGA